MATYDEVLDAMHDALIGANPAAHPFERVRTALAAAEAMGWKLVPRCPNKHMVRAACKAMSPSKRPTPKRVSNARKHAIRWNAMIDAAPAPPPQGEEKP